MNSDESVFLFTRSIKMLSIWQLKKFNIVNGFAQNSSNEYPNIYVITNKAKVRRNRYTHVFPSCNIRSILHAHAILV